MKDSRKIEEVLCLGTCLDAHTSGICISCCQLPRQMANWWGCFAVVATFDSATERYIFLPDHPNCGLGSRANGMSLYVWAHMDRSRLTVGTR
jgi:hypothetical protein